MALEVRVEGVWRNGKETVWGVRVAIVLGKSGRYFATAIFLFKIVCTTVNFLCYILPAPNLASINVRTPFSPISGIALTSTSSRIAYARCLFKYPSSQSPNSCSASLTASSTLPKTRLARKGGIRDTNVSAAVRLIARVSERVGGEGAGGGSVLLGKRARRA